MIKLNIQMTEIFSEFDQALNLAENISENISPRPPVGAIISKNGVVLGKGFTHPSPGNHAEINALENCKNKSKSVEGSTLYTTLEPCFHKGETEPCVDKIISSKISKVVIGQVDPNPKVYKKSIEKLIKSGIETSFVQDEIQRKRSKNLVEPFKYFIQNEMPYVTAKIAISLDGKIATKTGDSKWISSEESRNIVQEMRSLSDAIIIGSKTLKIDKPSLSAKKISNQPKFKVVLNSIPSNPERYEKLKSESKILVYCKQLPTNLSKWNGIEFIPVLSKNNKLNLESVLKDLAMRGCMNVLVEGGGQLIGSLIDLNLINQMRLFISPMLIGGINSTNSVGGEGIEFISQSKKLVDVEVERVNNDIMVTGKVKKHV